MLPYWLCRFSDLHIWLTVQKMNMLSQWASCFPQSKPYYLETDCFHVATEVCLFQLAVVFSLTVICRIGSAGTVFPLMFPKQLAFPELVCVLQSLASVYGAVTASRELFLWKWMTVHNTVKLGGFLYTWICAFSSSFHLFRKRMMCGMCPRSGSQSCTCMSAVWILCIQDGQTVDLRWLWSCLEMRMLH